MKKRIVLLMVMVSLLLFIAWPLAAEKQGVATSAKALVKVWVWSTQMAEIILNIGTDTDVISVEPGHDFDDQYQIIIDRNREDPRFNHDTPGIGIILMANSPSSNSTYTYGLQLRIFLRQVPVMFQISDFDQFESLPGQTPWFDSFMAMVVPPSNPNQYAIEEQVRNDPFNFVGEETMTPEAEELFRDPPQSPNAREKIIAVEDRQRLTTTWGRIKSPR